MDYKQELPTEVVVALDAYIERIKNIKWFAPSEDIKKEKVDLAVTASIKAFGVEASIEYRHLKTPQDWDAARDAAWDAARDAAREAARDAARDAAWDAARDAAWDAARGAARGAAWEAAREAAWGAADVLASFTPTYKLDTPFIKLIDLYEMGLYPIGFIDGKFIVYVPPSKLEFPTEL